MTDQGKIIDDIDALQKLLNQKDTLLLDFDGPVCSVFAGFPARIVADQLRDLLRENSRVSLPLGIETTHDPFEVFIYAAALSESEARQIQAALSAHELEAIATANPTPHTEDLIKSWNGPGRHVAIVSNNSKLAVESYLHAHELINYVGFISARESSDPELLKPSPKLVSDAVALSGSSLEGCLLVGDSVSDMLAARAAGVDAIGFANKAGKVAALETAGAELVVTSMKSLSIST